MDHRGGIRSRRNAASLEILCRVCVMSKADKSNARYFAGIIALVALGKFIYGVDFGMMNVALATISADLHVDPVILPWIVAVYSLSYAGFLVLGGRAADTFGRRRFCVFGLCLFGLGLFTATFAANVWVLIMARALEGIGSAFFIPASFSLVIAAIVLAWRLIPAHEVSKERHRVDVGGAILITAMVVLSLSALSAVGRYGWRSAEGPALLVGAALVLGAFLLLERRVREPLVPPT